MSYITKCFIPVISLTSIVIFCLITFPVISQSAQAAITDAEYKELLENKEFKRSDDVLRISYKAYIAASKNSAEKSERIQDQRRWIKFRDEDSARRFKKGSPAYIQYLIDLTDHRADTLSRLTRGDVMSVKADSYFYTLDYDKIPYNGIVKPEYKLDTN
jgi:uncharacterized protein YecT (DUF1311 family)